MTSVTTVPTDGSGTSVAPLPRWPQEEIWLPDRSLAVRVSALEAPTEGDHGREPGLLVHGLGGSSENWTDLMGLLGDRLDSVAPDLSGFGDSPPPRDGDYSLAGHARGMASLLAKRFPGRAAHVFGNSLGGAVAVHLAATRPDLVASLTLISPALPDLLLQRTNAHLPVVAIPGVGESLVGRYLKLDATVRTQATIDSCYADNSRLHPDRLAETIAEVRRRDALPYATDAFLSSLRGLIASYVQTGPNRPWRLAERVSCPVLLIYGRADKLVNSRAAHRATRHFPDARIVMFTDSGHVSQMEHPGRVARAWRELLMPRVATVA